MQALPRHWTTAAALVATLAFSAPTSAEEAAPSTGDVTIRVMVVDLKAQGVDDAVAKSLTDLIAGTLAKNSKFSVATSDDVRAMLRATEEKQLGGCDADACYKGIGHLLGAQSVVHGSIGKLGDTYTLNVSRIDTGKGEVEGRASEQAKKPDAFVGSIDRVAVGLSGAVTFATHPGLERLKSHQDCVWAAVQFDKERRSRVQRPGRTYVASFGSEHFKFDEYDKLSEFLPFKPDLAFLGRFPSCFGRAESHEDAFSIKEERPLVLKLGDTAAYDLIKLQRRRKLVLDVEFEIEGARIYPMREYDWRSCDGAETKPFSPADVAPNAWIRVKSAQVRDLFNGRRYAVTRQQWDPATERTTLVALPAAPVDVDEIFTDE